MLRFTSLSLSLMICLTSFTQHRDQDVNSTIKDVTVFLSGAEIHRTGKVTLNSGVTELKLKELSPSINGSSVQAKLANNNVTIISVNHKMDYLTEATYTPRITEIKDSLEDMSLKLKVRESRERVYREEKSMLISNKSIRGEQNGVDVEELEYMADFYRNRLTDIENKLLDIENSKKDFNLTISNLRRQLNLLNAKKTRNTSEVTVKVSCNSRIITDLNVSYVVNNAGWVPKYDVRSENTTDPVELTYKGDVYQNTGIEWESVNISLSTGNPTVSNSQPNLKPWYLYYYSNQRKKSYKAKGLAKQDIQQQNAYNNGYDDYLEESEGVEVLVYDMALVSEESRSSSDFTTVTESTVNTEFKIDLPYSITSDGQANTVEIVKHDLPVDYKYYAVPKLDNDAFLLARISGWGEYNLLPGDVNVYFEGTSVGTSYLNTETTEDTLDISMGRDNSIIIKREKIKDFCKTTSFGTNKKSLRGYEISVRNNKSNEIQLHLVDQIPLSKTKEIEVVLDEKNGAEHNEDTGKLKWELKIPNGETKKVIYKYTVKYPKNKSIGNL